MRFESSQRCEIYPCGGSKFACEMKLQIVVALKRNDEYALNIKGTLA